MYIIIKNQDDTSEIINIIYNKESSKLWITEYINENYIKDDITKMYEIYNNENGLKTILKKKETILKKGYFLNETKIHETIITFEILEYKCVNVPPIEIKIRKNDKLWENINEEINNRVLKKMDKDSLYQYINIVKNNINLKSNWTSNEYIHLSNEYLYSFRKELYSSIAKKTKRYGKYKGVCTAT